jgi:hypothetical protein
MQYAQLNQDGSYSHQITTSGNVEWDATHFCPASALTPDEAALFRVTPLIETEPPAIDPITQTVMRDGGELVGGQWQYKWRVDSLPAAQIAANTTARKAGALAGIDADTDAIYGAVLGNRAEEYTLAANEAQAFKTAGYTGTVPASVQSWATAKSWTATQAADDILLTAAQWVGAQSAIRAQRLLRKEQVRAATDAAGITAAMAAWAGFVAAIRGQLGA